MPCFARVFGYFMFYSEIAECGKSEQNLASYYYLLVVEIVVKGKSLLLRKNKAWQKQPSFITE